MGKAFDKQAWLETKAQKLEDSKRALEQGLNALQSSDDWRQMLRSMAKLGRFSIGRLSFLNAILILQQRPNAAQVATFETWKRHKRSVRVRGG